MIDVIDVPRKLKSLPTVLLFINVILVIYIYSIRDIKRTIISINSEIYNIKNNSAYIYIVAGIGLIVLLGLLVFLYNYRNVIVGGGKGVIIIWLIYLIIYCYHLYLSGDYITQNTGDITHDYKTQQIKNYTLKNVSIIILCVIIFYIGLVTHSIRGKKGLTGFVGLYMVYVFMKIWDITIEHDVYTDINRDTFKGNRDRYLYTYSLLTIMFILNLFKNIKIFVFASILILIMISVYNTEIIVRNKTLVSKYGNTIFPLILFIIYSIINFREFQDNSINTKFVYGLGFLITMLLLYIITNTEDMKIKSFITIFLVVIYNIFAIIYGSKDCDLSGFKILKRALKWTILVTIITSVLWKEFFQTSVSDNLQQVEDEGGGSSDITDTSELERKLKIEKSDDTSEIEEDNKSDERVQLQSRLNRIYETRARRDL
jgi:hypothetical protein